MRLLGQYTRILCDAQPLAKLNLLPLLAGIKYIFFKQYYNASNVYLEKLDFDGDTTEFFQLSHRA